MYDAKNLGEMNSRIETVSSLLQAKIKKGDFDVFLCHNSEDKLEVNEIGEELKEVGLLSWLDEWEMRPGLPWQEALEKEIEQIKSAAVFVGKKGIGPWQLQELNAFLREFVNRGCPVIPVLLPDAPKEPKLPIFLKGMTWIDFRKNERDSIERLIWGITGERNWMPLFPRREKPKKIESESTSINQIFDIPKIKTQEEEMQLELEKEKGIKAKTESINKGLALNRLGKYKEAITAFDKVLEIDPDKIAWNNKGLALNNLGKYQEAITSYLKALEIGPQDKEAWNNKGLALNNLDKYQEAITAYDKALEIDPLDKLAFDNKEITLNKLHRPAFQPNKSIIPGHYVCNLTLAGAIKEIYLDRHNFKYPHGEAGRVFNDGSFVSFNGRVGTVIYAYCDFTDKKNVPLSSTNRDDLLKLGMIQNE